MLRFLFTVLYLIRSQFATMHRTRSLLVRSEYGLF